MCVCVCVCVCVCAYVCNSFCEFAFLQISSTYITYSYLHFFCIFAGSSNTRTGVSSGGHEGRGEKEAPQGNRHQVSDESISHMRVRETESKRCEILQYRLSGPDFLTQI